MSTMTPIEFVLWFDGASDMVLGDAPTPREWAVIKENLGSAIAGVVAKKLLEKAEEAQRQQARMEQESRMEADYKHMLLKQQTEMMRQSHRAFPGRPIPIPGPGIAIGVSNQTDLGSAGVGGIAQSIFKDKEVYR